MFVLYTYWGTLRMLCSIAISSPVGRLAISATEEAIVAIGWSDEAQGEETALLAEARRQLLAYFERRLKLFDLPLRPAGSTFDQRVWAAMRHIPHGQTRSYGELAIEIGSAPRAIGRACGRNPIPIVIPCHRVLGRNGLGGYSGGAGLPTKQRLLELERTDPSALSCAFSAGGWETAAPAPSLI
jgi:methylated-DNA-[protein]-cysteine S-methyltransferase